MNTLLSHLRHYLTFLAGIGGMLLTQSLITPEEVSQANAAGAQLIEPLMVILGLVAAGVARLALSGASKFFESVGSKVSGILAPVVTIGGLAMGAGFIGFSLPSCTALDLATLRQVPTKFCLTSDRGAVCYSSKSGLSAEVDATSSK